MPKQEKSVYYNSNCTPDGNHSFGPPEIVILYPEERLSRAALDEYLEITLNENSDLVEELLQQICQEGYAEVRLIEQDKDGNFIAYAEEVVCSGCRDLDYRSDFNVRLTVRREEKAVCFYLSENAVLSFQHWMGGGPDDLSLPFKNL
jgi:hypothetical protein